MQAGKKIGVWVSLQDYKYLKDHLISPTDLLRAAIREVQCAPIWYRGDNIT